MVYSAVSALPWAGSVLSAACPTEMARITEAVDVYLVGGGAGMGHLMFYASTCWRDTSLDDGRAARWMVEGLLTCKAHSFTACLVSIAPKLQRVQRSK